MSKIKYTTLFDYAVKEWRLTWNDCHEVFYYDDLVDEINSEVFPPLWGKNYAKAMDIILYYMREKGCNAVKIYS